MEEMKGRKKLIVEAKKYNQIKQVSGNWRTRKGKSVIKICQYKKTLNCRYLSSLVADQMGGNWLHSGSS
jgi:hypothetical protein